jgi:hypothetical protein
MALVRLAGKSVYPGLISSALPELNGGTDKSLMTPAPSLS